MLTELPHLQYTILNSDENDYSIIKSCLEAPSSPYTRLSVIGLTTLCSMLLIGKEDYIEIDNVKYNVTDNYSDINSISLIEILSNLIVNENIKVSLDNCNRMALHQ